MKTRILKLGMPVMAFLMAIAFAFASENKPSENDDALTTGYIMQSGLCVPTSKNCDNINLYPCTYDKHQVFQLQDNATSCSVPLYDSKRN